LLRPLQVATKLQPCSKPVYGRTHWVNIVKRGEGVEVQRAWCTPLKEITDSN